MAQAGQFFNAPANGPAGIFLARYDDRLRRAQQMADWIDETLIDPETHLVFDGIKAGSLVRAQYTYCQGAVLGLETELAARTEDSDHAKRVHRLVAAVADNMAPDGVIKGAGGGDGGLFNGILARYLAFVATTLPGDTADDTTARDTARTLVLKSAQSAWDYRQTVDGLPLFGPFWDRSAELPTAVGTDAQVVEGAVNPSQIPERDLSVQVSGWMLMEAAHTVAGDSPDDEVADEEVTDARSPRGTGTRGRRIRTRGGKACMTPADELAGGWAPDKESVEHANLTRFLTWLADTGRGAQLVICLGAAIEAWSDEGRPVTEGRRIGADPADAVDAGVLLERPRRQPLP